MPPCPGEAFRGDRPQDRLPLIGVDLPANALRYLDHGTLTLMFTDLEEARLKIQQQLDTGSVLNPGETASITFSGAFESESTWSKELVDTLLRSLCSWAFFPPLHAQGGKIASSPVLDAVYG